ncbi:hypothetical protein BJ917_0273 [Pseudomonas sp. WPR_5_2]|uniref:hypothetical protein n=1 Tax=Pseudomonas sp. WPR_5_2 TaxID=1907371 RepID=UPI000EADD677|nr:hypothetical protein [Pseudomonas sp. WPR_5_2]RKS27431.1 hypothetical protein BJ917_0273 [Pseudomonas sp. WPR_5_2]
MNTEKFKSDLGQTCLELDAATTQVMELVNAGKAFGAAWHAAIERERKAYQIVHWILDSPIVPKMGAVDGFNDLSPYTEAEQFDLTKAMDRPAA